MRGSPSDSHLISRSAVATRELRASASCVASSLLTATIDPDPSGPLNDLALVRPPSPRPLEPPLAPWSRRLLTVEVPVTTFFDSGSQDCTLTSVASLAAVKRALRRRI